MNIERLVHPEVEYSQGRERTVLEHGEPTARLDVRITGTVERTAGSTGDAAVYDDHLQRLVSHTLRADSFDLMESEISLRDLYEYHRCNVAEIRSRTEVAASDINSGTAADFDISYSIHGWRNYLLNPKESFWPAWDGKRGPSLTDGFILTHQFETDAVNSDSDPGTGAIFSAGSDTYEFTDGPTLEVTQVSMPGLRIPPAVIPAYEIIESEQIQAAVGNFVMRFQNQFVWDLLIARYLADSDLVAEAAGSVNKIGLVSSSVDILDDDTPAWQVEQDAINRFLGYNGESGTESSPSTFPIDPVGGRLRQRVNPRQFTDLRLVFDVDAPSTTPGRIRIFQAVDKTIEGVTRLQNAKR